ncbi:hypothetical protein M9H77_33293 [Catharanthus roseus]|uniref:Uncharacterized protein n=1 Tax=Catharanthus roseus TaxID=4058 RepID=A0ACB9ZJR5_CATRO|nr:hypothetical protein M9H77_33293 [Catharanthus roseus]
MEKTATAIKRPRIESASSNRTLEINVISAEDLRINKRQSVNNSFVVIGGTDSIASSSSASYTQNGIRTKTDSEGGSYPVWNEKIAIDLPMHARFFTVEVKCKKNGVNNRVIGTAEIPVSDFLGGLVPENYLHFLSYRLWDNHGERNGIINLSVRVKNPGVGIGNGNSTGSKFAPVHGWSAAAGGVPVDSKLAFYNQGQVVTGIPVGVQNF